MRIQIGFFRHTDPVEGLSLIGEDSYQCPVSALADETAISHFVVLQDSPHRVECGRAERPRIPLSVGNDFVSDLDIHPTMGAAIQTLCQTLQPIEL